MPVSASKNDIGRESVARNRNGSIYQKFLANKPVIKYGKSGSTDYQATQKLIRN